MQRESIKLSAAVSALVGIDWSEKLWSLFETLRNGTEGKLSFKGGRGMQEKQLTGQQEGGGMGESSGASCQARPGAWTACAARPIPGKVNPGHSENKASMEKRQCQELNPGPVHSFSRLSS